MDEYDETEILRQKLLDEVYAGAFSNRLSAILLYEETIRKAGAEELQALARQCELWLT